MDHVPPPSAHYFQAHSFAFEEESLSPAAQRVISLNPQLILGSYQLFEYDHIRQVIHLSSSFRDLLELCVNLNILDPKVLKAKSINELNAIFQKPQGSQGGFLRKPGSERWDLNDAEAMKENKALFDSLFQRLGFNRESLLTTSIKVDHCVVFGASAPRVETRIISTLDSLRNGLSITGHIFLLGSNRKLTDDEKRNLEDKVKSLPADKQAYWNETFANPELATEANACSFLWNFLVSQDLKDKLNLVSINSTRIGFSYNDTEGHRSTTETTVEDWMSFYNPEEPQNIFAFTEQPYGRLCDQFLDNILSDKRQASLEELEKRVKNTTFHFVNTNPTTPPLQSAVIDEIARHIYRIKVILEYLQKLEATCE